MFLQDPMDLISKIYLSKFFVYYIYNTVVILYEKATKNILDLTPTPKTSGLRSKMSEYTKKICKTNKFAEEKT